MANIIEQEFNYITLSLYNCDYSQHTDEEIRTVLEFLKKKFNYSDIVITQRDEGDEYYLDVEMGWNSQEPFYIYNAEYENGYAPSWDDPGCSGAIYCYYNIDEMIVDVVGKEWPLELDCDVIEGDFEEEEQLWNKLDRLAQEEYDTYWEREMDDKRCGGYY